MSVDTITGDVRLRMFKTSDIKELTHLLNNSRVLGNLRDSIPNPYTLKDAENFISFCITQYPVLTFAIDYKGKLAGCIGLVPQDDVYRLSAELGYWIGEPYWNQGIATEAVQQAVSYAFESLPVIKVFAGVFDFNKASQKVLEKAGFTLEAILKKAIVKNGIIYDEHRYSLINESK